MTTTEAKAYIELYGATSTPPEISSSEINQLITACLDENGEVPDDMIDSCVADVWLIKTGRVTDHHDVTVNGRTFQASQVKAHCEERERFFRRRLPVRVS